MPAVCYPDNPRHLRPEASANISSRPAVQWTRVTRGGFAAPFSRGEDPFVAARAAAEEAQAEAEEAGEPP